MARIQHILVPVDFSPSSEAALPYALAFARRYKAKITLLHVIPTNVYAVGEMTYWQLSEQVFSAFEEEAAQKLAATFTPEERQELEIEEKVTQGVPFAEIVQEAREGQVDLIIMGTHGRTGLSHFVLGSVTEHVIRKAPCPVLTVRVPEEKEG